VDAARAEGWFSFCCVLLVKCLVLARLCGIAAEFSWGRSFVKPRPRLVVAAIPSRGGGGTLSPSHGVAQEGGRL
jgi:hypothetical protein